MTQEPKPREWWISINLLSPPEGSSGFNNDPPLVQVIEYSAYLAVVKAHDEMVRLNKDLQNLCRQENDQMTQELKSRE